MHGALFHAIGPTGIGATDAKPYHYPSELAQRLCHDHVPNVYECRHGIGHGVLYAVALGRVPSLMNYSACRQPRPYSVAISGEMFDAVWRICAEANAVATQNEQFNYSQGCTSGAAHSGYLFDTNFAGYGGV